MNGCSVVLAVDIVWVVGRLGLTAHAVGKEGALQNEPREHVHWNHRGSRAPSLRLLTPVLVLMLFGLSASHCASSASI